MNKITKLLISIIFGFVAIGFLNIKNVSAGGCPSVIGECSYGSSINVLPYGTCDGPDTGICQGSGSDLYQIGTAYYGGSCGDGQGEYYHSYCCKVSSCDVGGGGGGGGEGSIDYSCPADYTISWSPISKYQCYHWGTNVTGNAVRPMTNGGSYCLNAVCADNEPGDPCPYSAYEYATCVAPEPTNYDPIGFHDGSDCVTSYGWTCDQNDYNTPISVDLYADGAGWGIGTLLGRVTADIVGGPELEPFFGGTRNHVFSFNTPTSLIDGIAHTIYAFAINNPIDSNHNPLLTNSPITMLCTPTCTVDLLPSSSTISPSATTPLTASVTNLGRW